MALLEDRWRAGWLASALWLGIGAAGCGEEPASADDSSEAGDEGDEGGADEDQGTSGSRDAGLDAQRPPPRDAARPGREDAAGPSDDAGSDARVSDAATALDAGAGLAPFPTDGEPLEGADREWTYIEFPDTSCRDGSKAGIAVSKSASSKKLMIYLEGGGACFDFQTCLANPANVGAQRDEKTTGVFDRTNAKNPVRDWSFVYVPYCTGDTHGGTKEDGNIEGLGPQKFVGYSNMKAFLDRIVPTFRDAEDVLLTGISAGGFGAAQNAVLVQRAFPDVKVKVIDDSGPPLSTRSIPTCLQKKWRNLWGLDESFLADCGASCPNPDDYAQDYGLYLARTFDDRPSGLIEATQDGIISGFFGIGTNECTGVLLLTPVPGPTFESDLLAFRDEVEAYPWFGTWFPTGTQHTWLRDDSFYTGKAGDVLLVDWVQRIVDGAQPGHAGP